MRVARDVTSLYRIAVGGFRVEIDAVGVGQHRRELGHRLVRRQTHAAVEQLRLGDDRSQLRVLPFGERETIRQLLDLRFTLLEIAFQLFDVVATAFAAAARRLAVAVADLLLALIVGARGVIGAIAVVMARRRE